ncbi:MAG: hypothetical protein ACP5NQ_05255 [Vulcanisaeta sp.]
MSIEDVKARIIEFRDFLINIDRANAIADALPGIAINLLTSIVLLLAAYIIYEVIYVIYYGIFIAMMIGAVLLTLATVYLIYVIVIKVFRKIQRAGQDATSKYARWDNLLNEGLPGIIAILESIDYDELIIRIHRGRLGYVIAVIIYIVIFTLIAGFALFGLIFLVILPIFVFPIPIQLLTQYSIPISLTLGFALTMKLAWNRISESIRTLWMIDSITWELRWIEHDIKRLYRI